jgi:hypothetical protein
VAALEAELKWLMEVIEFRFSEHWGHDNKWASIRDIEVPALEDETTPFGHFINDLELSPPERLVLILALAPHLRPDILDPFLQGHADKTHVTEFGGHKGQVHRGFLPTIETALFILAGHDLAERIHCKLIFDQDHLLFSGNWLRTDQLVSNEPPNSALLIPSRELVQFLTTGDMGEPEFGPSFPAQKIDTKRTWEELVLPGETLLEVQDILNWITHEQAVMREMRLQEKVAPGFRALFYGPPGTGKTFTASLLGKASGRDVYRIDLSMVVSKYIGETEKNLKVVFDKAQRRGWILFFDEADALFGKRTDVSDSKDRYANQEVSYLLQRVENFDGIVILATNSRENMDKAFTRRFQSVINFPIPNAAERLRLWEKAIPETYSLAASANLRMIADRFEVAGGSIMNVVRHCALRAAVRGRPVIEEADLLEGIKREYKKSGRIMN